MDYKKISEVATIIGTVIAFVTFLGFKAFDNDTAVSEGQSHHVTSFAIINAATEIINSEMITVTVLQSGSLETSLHESSTQLGKDAYLHNKQILKRDLTNNVDSFMIRTTFDLPFKIFGKNSLFNYFSYSNGSNSFECIDSKLVNFPDNKFRELFLDYDIQIVTEKSTKGRACLKRLGNLDIPRDLLILAKESDNELLCGFSFETKALDVCTDEQIEILQEFERKSI